MIARRSALCDVARIDPPMIQTRQFTADALLVIEVQVGDSYTRRVIALG